MQVILTIRVTRGKTVNSLKVLVEFVWCSFSHQAHLWVICPLWRIPAGKLLIIIQPSFKLCENWWFNACIAAVCCVCKQPPGGWTKNSNACVLRWWLRVMMQHHCHWSKCTVICCCLQSNTYSAQCLVSSSRSSFIHLLWQMIILH